MSPIRPVTNDDVARCVAFGLEAFRSVFASFETHYGKDLFARMRPDWEDTQSADIESACIAGDKETWVAETDGAVTGFVVLTMDGDTGLGEIELLAVDPDRQRRGLGTELSNFAAARFRDGGMAYATTATRSHPGHLPARRSFEKVGFAPMRIQPVTLVTKLNPASRPSPLPQRTGNRPDVRLIAEGDVTECVSFGLEAFRPVFASFETHYGKDLFDRLRPDWENAQSAYIESVCRAEDKETWVTVTDDGVVSGFVVVILDVFTGVGAIELLAVDPSQQGRGLGTRLNESALVRLSDAGMAYAVVSTGSDPGHAAARHSYENVGFTTMPVQWNLLVKKL